MGASLTFSFLEILCKMSLQAIVLAAVVWLVTRLTPKAPAAWRHALWLLVLVKLFLPPFVHFPSQLAFWQSVHPSISQHVMMPEGGSISNLPKMRTSRPIVSHGQKPQPQTPVYHQSPKQYDPVAVAAILWAIGALAMIALLCGRLLQQSRLVKQSEECTTDLQRLFLLISAPMGIKRLPKLRLSARTGIPMLVGYIKPIILLPIDIKNTCNETNLKAMLLHELAHIKRRDILVMWMQQITQVIFFFNPALWLAGSEIRKERELACDELVLATRAISAADYAAGYVSAIKLANGFPALSTSVSMAEPISMEKRRLTLILSHVSHRRSWQWAVALFLIAGVSLPTFAGLSSRPKTSIRNVQRAEGVLMLRNSPKLHPAETQPEILKQYKFDTSDIHRLVNDLFNAGAESVCIDGYIITATSWEKQTGAPTLVDSLPVRMPVNISVTGDPAKLRKAMEKADAQDSLGSLDVLPVREIHAGTEEPASANNSGQTNQIITAADQRDLASVRDMILNGADVNAADSSGHTALHSAVVHGDLQMAKMLLEHGANVNVKESGDMNWGWYPLHLALRSENKQMIRLLVLHGADVNAARDDMWTPLHTAAYHGQSDIIEMLILKGAKLTARDRDLSTPLHIAINQQQIDAARVMLKYGADVNAVTQDGYAVLHTACSSPRTESVEFLLSRGADINLRTRTGDTPLQIATRWGNPEVVKLLIRKHAKLNIENNKGDTPLCEAAYWGLPEIVEPLLAAGADVNDRNDEGLTPLGAVRAAYEQFKAGKLKGYECPSGTPNDWLAVDEMLVKRGAKL